VTSKWIWKQKFTPTGLLAYAVQHQLLVHHMDVETAFLNGELEEEIFMEIPLVIFF